MRHSRYIWILMIVTISLVGMVWWFSPYRIISALANPHYAFTPRATVQHFWSLLDSRQVNLAQDLLYGQVEQDNFREFARWKQTVESNPLLSLQKVEFVEGEKPESIIVKVSWSTSLKEELNETYVFNLHKGENGWQIHSFRRMSDLSLAIFDADFVFPGI